MSKLTHISYNSIEQCRNTLRDLKKARNNTDFNIPSEVEFTGTVKIHGTNCSICYSNKTGIYCQSRNNVINLTYDNQGFCMFIEKNKSEFESYFKLITERYNIDLDIYTLSLYGEWCGEGIQKGVAVSKLPKCFCIFDCKVSNLSDSEFKSYWLDVSLKNTDGNCVIAKPSDRIYNIYDFQTFCIKINLDSYQDSQKQLEEYTLQVEKCCPFAKALGVEGIGEGIVWRYWYNNNNRWIFKTKGDEHKVTKEKVLVSVDIEKVENIKQFVENTCTINRFEQAIDHIYKINPDSPQFGNTPSMKDCKVIIDWIRNDIVKEETDTMIENGFTTKDIISILSKKIVEMLKNF